MNGIRGHVFYGVSVLAKTQLLSALDKLGVPRPDVELLMGDALWLSGDRYRIRRALEACMFGSLDMLGIQRFQFSAEWIATWIALVVHEANHLTACAWWHGAQSADALQMDPESIPIAEGMDAPKIFELVKEAYIAIHHEHTDFPERLQEAVQSGRRAFEAAEAEHVAASQQ